MFPCKTWRGRELERERRMLRQGGKFGSRQGSGIRRECKAGPQAVQFGGKCYAGQKLGNKCEMDNFTFYNWSA